MNQSNKALRELVAEKLAGLVNIYKYAELGYTATPKEKDVQNAATQTLTLVTNHIKEALPKGKDWFNRSELKWKEQGDERFTRRDSAMYDQGYNQALDEVQSILKEISK